MRRGGAVQPVPPSRSVRSGRQAGRTVRVNSFLDEIVIPLRERVVRAERDRVSITAGLGCSVQTLVCRRQLRDASLSCPASSPVASCGFGRAVGGRSEAASLRTLSGTAPVHPTQPHPVCRRSLWKEAWREPSLQKGSLHIGATPRGRRTAENSPAFGRSSPTCPRICIASGIVQDGECGAVPCREPS